MPYDPNYQRSVKQQRTHKLTTISINGEMYKRLMARVGHGNVGPTVDKLVNEALDAHADVEESVRLAAHRELQARLTP